MSTVLTRQHRSWDQIVSEIDSARTGQDWSWVARLATEAQIVDRERCKHPESAVRQMCLEHGLDLVGCAICGTETHRLCQH